MKLLSHDQFMWFASFTVLALAIGWFVVDSVRLARALRQDRSDPHVRDLIFGGIIGLMVASLGIGGVLHYHLTH